MKQSFEVIRNKFPLIHTIPSHGPKLYQALFNIGYLFQYINYNQLNIDLSYEINVLVKIIKNFEKKQLHPDYCEYLSYCSAFGGLFLKSAVHGQDEINQLALLDDFLNIDLEQPNSHGYLQLRINSLTNSLKENKPISMGLSVDRSKYMLNALLKVINELEGNDLFASFVSLMKTSTRLKIYDDHRDMYLSLMARFVNNDQYLDLRKLFKLAQLMLINKEYELFKSIIYSLLNSTLTQKKKRLSTFIYAVKFLENIPEELTVLCALPIYQKYTLEPVHYSIHYSIADWTSLMLEQLNQIPGRQILLDFYIDFFVAKAIERFPLEELLHFYANLNRISEQLAKQAQEKRILNSVVHQESLAELIQNYAPKLVMSLWKMGSDYYHLLTGMLQLATNKMFGAPLETQYKFVNFYCFRSFMSRLGNALVFEDINSLDINAKIDFISINKSFYAHELLNNLNSEEQSKLLKIQIEDSHYHYNNFIALYPLQPAVGDIIYNKTLPIPTSFYLYILTHEYYRPHQFVESFQLFYERFQKGNRHAAGFAGENNVVDYGEFMMQNVPKLFTLFDIMSDDLFLFMNKMIATSAQKIQRYFNKMDFIHPKYLNTLKYILKKYRNEILKQPGSFYDIILLQLGQLELMFEELKAKNIKTSFYVEQFEEMARNAISLKEISESLSDALMSFYKEILEIPKHYECTNWDCSKLQLLTSLLTARKNIRNNLFCPLFDKMVAYDLRDDVQFSDFAYDTEQIDPLVKSLALHNQKIEKTLIEHQIDTEKAFHYKTVKQFTYERVNDLSTLAIDLYMDMINLEKLLPLKNVAIPHEQSEPISSDIEKQGFFKRKSPIVQLCDSIQLIKKQVNKKVGVTQTKAIQNGTIDKHINIIAQNLPALLKQEVSEEVKKQGQRFLDNKNKLILARKQPNKYGQVKKQFTIKQWDKNQIQTFILGDYLSCCLAPDGGAFQNMVLRRSDVANMMHVIIDEAINEPVCGNWLFFAFDKQNPDDIYVVANYFEIRVGYALNEAFCKAMIKELVDFTGTYSQSIGAKGFLLSPLSYGLIPDFKGQYAKKRLEIGKVGGFFDPRKLDPNYNVSSFNYDLDLSSLYNKKFYLYEPSPCLIELLSLQPYG